MRGGGGGGRFAERLPHPSRSMHPIRFWGSGWGYHHGHIGHGPGWRGRGWWDYPYIDTVYTYRVCATSRMGRVCSSLMTFTEAAAAFIAALAAHDMGDQLQLERVLHDGSTILVCAYEYSTHGWVKQYCAPELSLGDAACCAGCASGGPCLGDYVMDPPGSISVGSYATIQRPQALGVDLACAAAQSAVECAWPTMREKLRAEMERERYITLGITAAATVAWIFYKGLQKL